MGRQSNNSAPTEPTAASSSIALLQQRFRDLQRVKERRELMQRFPEPARAAAEITMAGSTEPISSQPPTRLGQRDGSLSPGLAGQRNPTYRPETWPVNAPTEGRTSSWPGNGSGAAGSSRGFESHSDVDTSLHL